MIKKTEPDEIIDYLVDASNFKGAAEAVYLPENTDELKELLSYSYSKNIPVTISGAGTGLTGSRVPLEGIIISTEKLNKIISLNKDNLTVSLQPAVRLEELESFLNDYNLFYPPNPTEKLSFLGGNISTNGSGSRTFKYGMTRNFINYLQIILPDGDELKIERGKVFANGSYINLMTEKGRRIEVQLPDLNMPDCKNAAGYYIKKGMDAIDLFIGSEGTLGIIVEARLSVNVEPDSIMAGIVFFDNFENLSEFIIESRNFSNERNKIDYRINDCPSARLIEYFNKDSLEMLLNSYPQIPSEAIGAVWFEQEYTINFEDKILTEWLEIINKYSAIADKTWFALNEAEHARFREFRHQLPLMIYETTEQNKQYKIGTDTAVPNEHFKKLFNDIHDILLESGLRSCVFGHVGNCHLHGNLFVKNEEEKELAQKAYNQIIELSLSLKGTVSAEHGIGKLKKQYLEKMYGKDIIDQMKELKRVFDPKMLLNRGNMFD